MPRSALRNAAAVGVATGAYGFSFGALSVAAGLSLPQTAALSAVMFTGASQFAFVGVLANGGAGAAAVATAAVLGTRNAFYGLRLADTLRPPWWRRPFAAHLTIDESTAMALAASDQTAARTAFWATGVAVFICWNAATIVGTLVHFLGNPSSLGLDEAAPAAFVALLFPQLKTRKAWVVAAAGALVALAAVPFVPTGAPVLLAAGVAAVAGWSRPSASSPGPSLQCPATPAQRSSGPVS
jgi:predicted branched-subunit amino acid permease